MADERTLLERHRKVLPSWMALYYDEPIQLERGEGRHVWDGAGNRDLDFFGGILTTSTAHALPEVVTAVQGVPRGVGLVGEAQISHDERVTPQPALGGQLPRLGELRVPEGGLGLGGGRLA